MGLSSGMLKFSVNIDQFNPKISRLSLLYSWKNVHDRDEPHGIYKAKV